MEFKTWLDALIYPKETFRAEKEGASLGDALNNIAVAGLIAGIVFGLISGLLLGLFGFVIGIITFPIIVIISFLFESLIFFILAKILGGKGDFSTQTYLISLFTAPLVVLSLVGLIPIMGWVLYIPIVLYSLYPLTIALRESHGFSTARANLTWLIPRLIIGLIIVLLLSMISPIVIMGLTQMYPDNLYGTVKVMDCEYSEDTLELVMLNAVETNQIENVRITLSGSGCENPSKIPAWDSGETKTIRAKCDRKSPGEEFTVEMYIKYDAKKGRGKFHHTKYEILEGIVE